MSTKKKEIKTTVVTFAEYTEYDFVDPATFLVVDACQNYVYYHTSSRAEAQAAANSTYGHNKYIVKAVKLQKTKSRQESGGYSCTGTATR